MAAEFTIARDVAGIREGLLIELENSGSTDLV
jgi:hypothetical protein